MRVWRLSAILLMLWMVWMVPPAIAAEQKPLKGIALVIGESRYTNLPALQNPANDEKAMAELFGKLGFDVTTAADVDHKKLQRTLDRFVEDAADADVAVIYYSGHGIEAGGENYLMPTDADISTPAAAGDSAVPVGALLDELAKTVPVSIVLLDACRSNAFPAGTTITLPGSGTVAVDPTGLAAVRGPTPVLPASDPKSLGMVVGFAAAPGMAALDGPPNGNSPYAAALLKHLSAGGYSFGDVMTMVSEEVYLKTGARQLPWTNSSLRRVLNFGAGADAPDADEAAISEGRRRLLLSIASLPDTDRQQVEGAAREASVPMDALYGLLEALGGDVPADPVALGKLLTQQTTKLKSILNEQAALTTSDAEIERLAGLAQRALQEGVLDVSLNFWEQAKARYAVVAKTLDATEANLKSRRLEGGELLRRTADTYALAGDYAKAADNYGAAYEQVAKWDGRLAFEYRLNQADALQAQSSLSGDPKMLEAAFLLYREAIELAPGGAGSTAWASAQNGFGTALELEGMRRGDPALLGQAAGAINAALSVWTLASDRTQWLDAKRNAASLLSELGQFEPGTEKFEQAVSAYRDLLKAQRKEDDPFDWAMNQANLANALSFLGERTSDTAPLHDAVQAFQAALAAIDPQANPFEWALVQGNMGTTLTSLGSMGESERFQDAVMAFSAALEIDTRERTPMQWANDKNNLGLALDKLGETTQDDSKLLAAIEQFRDGLSFAQPEDQPLLYGHLQANLSNALMMHGLGQSGTADMEAAAAAAREALLVTTKDIPLERAPLLNLLGRSIAITGIRKGDRKVILNGRKILIDAQADWAKVGQTYDTYFKRRFDEIDAALAKLK